MVNGMIQCFFIKNCDNIIPQGKIIGLLTVSKTNITNYL